MIFAPGGIAKSLERLYSSAPSGFEIYSKYNIFSTASQDLFIKQGRFAQIVRTFRASAGSG